MEQRAQIPDELDAKDDVHQAIDLPINHKVRRSSTGSVDSPQQKYGDRYNPSDPSRKVNRVSGGSDRSIEQSPMHRNQAKGSWERKGPSEGGQGTAPSTPGRFKTRTAGRGDESPDRGPTVPKFGEWDESNPSSADGYTGIFNQVREEKQAGSAKVPQITDDSVYMNSYHSGGSNSKSSSCWCLGRRRK